MSNKYTTPSGTRFFFGKEVSFKIGSNVKSCAADIIELLDQTHQLLSRCVERVESVRLVRERPQYSKGCTSACFWVMRSGYDASPFFSIDLSMPPTVYNYPHMAFRIITTLFTVI